MIMKYYTVLDRATAAFLPPFAARSNGEAIRSFTDAINDPKHHFNTHPGDYSLWYSGDFDDGSGAFVTYEPERLLTGTEAIISQ